MKIERVKLFDPQSPNKSLGILMKQASGILNWDNLKYKHNYPMYKKLLANFWTPLTF